MITTILMCMVLGGIGNDFPAYTDDTVRQAEKTGRPVLIVVSEPGCMYCEGMKRNVFPLLRQRPIFRRVIASTFFADNDDKHQFVSEQLGVHSYPTLVMFRRIGPNQWRQERLVGYRPVEEVESFIQGSVKDADTQKKTEKAKLPVVPKPVSQKVYSLRGEVIDVDVGKHNVGTITVRATDDHRKVVVHINDATRIHLRHAKSIRHLKGHRVEIHATIRHHDVVAESVKEL